MKRDISKAIAEYHALVKGKDHGAAAFYGSDYEQIMDRYQEKPTAWDLVYDSMAAGFIIGMRYQKRQQKKK